MNPATFPEANIVFHAPSDLSESQVMTIPAFYGTVMGGSLDGCTQVIVAWLPTEQDLKDLNAGAAVYLSCIGGLLPHCLTTRFSEARRVA